MDYLMMIIRELEKERNRIKRRMLRRIGKGKQIQEETNPEAPKAEGTGKAVRADIFLVLRSLPARRPPAARPPPARRRSGRIGNLPLNKIDPFISQCPAA